jgi:N-carbamoylputrescine amidase
MTLSSSSFKLALIQDSYPGSHKEALEKSKNHIKEAAKRGAELVVLKELHIREYFCQSEDVKFFEYAKSFESDIEFFSRVAKDSGVVLVTSLFERRATGLYHNTAVVFDKDGSEAGRYRKMHIPDDPGFYEKFYFTPGDMGFTPIETSLGKLGVLICWDQWYPEAARLMALSGAEILIYPTAIGWFMSDSEKERSMQLEAWKAVQRGHAVANGAYVVAVNRVGFEKDSSGVMEGVKFWGNSFAYGPQGEALALGGIEEEIVLVDIDRKKVEDVRNIWPFFRDRRIEEYGELKKRFRL